MKGLAPWRHEHDALVERGDRAAAGSSSVRAHPYAESASRERRGVGDLACLAERDLGFGARDRIARLRREHGRHRVSVRGVHGEPGKSRSRSSCCVEQHRHRSLERRPSTTHWMPSATWARPGAGAPAGHAVADRGARELLGVLVVPEVELVHRPRRRSPRIATAPTRSRRAGRACSAHAPPLPRGAPWTRWRARRRCAGRGSMSSGSSRSSAQVTAARRLSSSATSRARQASSSGPSRPGPASSAHAAKYSACRRRHRSVSPCWSSAFLRVLAQGLEHPEPAVTVRGVLGDDHRLRHQRRERVEHVQRLDAVARHDRLRRSCVEAAGEHPETVEHQPLPLARAASTTSRPWRARSDGVPPPCDARR